MTIRIMPPMLVNVTIPVFNEEVMLPQSIPQLHEFLTGHCRFSFEIVIVDNASTDHTWEVAGRLQQSFPDIRCVHLDRKGRGGALKRVWSESAADILSYMDVDLSTNLFSFPPLIEGLLCGGFDLGIGSRLMPASTTQRCLKREVISRAYNLLVKAFFRTRFSDAQCGFKAITRRAAGQLLPQIEDAGWFFDTELLIIAEKAGFRIFDLPVSWIEDLDSRVRILPTALADLQGLMRVRRNFARGRYHG